jgi:ubiquinone/menaquinone biosynthesis C-methylase UbiE
MASDADEAQEHITAFWNVVAPWIEAVRRALPESPSDVLDVATGTGFLALIMTGLGHRVTGIDLAPQMLEEARASATRRGLAVRLLPGDAVAPDFADESSSMS